MFVGDREIVERGRVGRVDAGGALPLHDRLAPEALLRDNDAKIDVLLRFAARIRRTRGSTQGQEHDQAGGTGAHMSERRPHYSHGPAAIARNCSHNRGVE